jgi:hypothetical protein
VAVAPEIRLVVPEPPVPRLLVPEVPDRGWVTPLWGHVDTAPSCCCSGRISAVAAGPAPTEATIASCVRRLPPQALSAIAESSVVANHLSELVRTPIDDCLP